MDRWYRKGMRRSLVDTHVEEWNPEFLSKWDPKVYFENIKRAHINAPMIYLQSHVGLCYWDTKSGKEHPAFVGTNKTKELFDLCNKEGLNPLAYYSLIFNNWAYDAHPEWRMKTVYGTGSRHTGSRYGLCCPNNMEYREFVWAQMKEFTKEFDFKSIFLDMTFWPMICHCDSCKKRYKEETGFDMPEEIDWNDENFKTLVKKRSEWLEEFALEATKHLKEGKPEATVTHQYSNILHYWRTGVDINVNNASDYISGDLYGGIAEQSFACKMYYDVSREQPFEYMTGRCYENLSDHTTTKTDEMMMVSTMLTTMHHGASMIIDAIDPRGTMNTKVYDKIGKVYTETEKYEKYLSTGKLKYNVALLFNLNGKMDVERNHVKIGSDEENYTGIPHEDAIIGAANSLREHHIAYGVICNSNIERIYNYKVTVISDAPNLSEKEMEILKDYVKRGGKLYLSGHSAQPLVEEIFKVKFTDLSDECVTYVSPTKLGETLMSDEFSALFPMTLQQKQMRSEGETDAEILATITLPYTKPNPNSDFMDMGQFYHKNPITKDSPSYKFASIHSNPPGIYTKMPAVMKKDFGEGTIVYASAPIEEAKRYQHSDFFANLIRMLGKDEIDVFKSNAPSVVELIEFEEESTGEQLLGLVNLQDAFRPLPVFNFDVEVKCGKKPSEITLAPDETPLEFTYENGFAKVHIDELKLYKMIRITY